MKNVTTSQTRFTATQTNYEDSTGMMKGYTRTKNLIKIYDNGTLIKEFINSNFDALTVIFCVDNNVSDIKICKNEKSIKTKWFWTSRKDESAELIIIK